MFGSWSGCASRAASIGGIERLVRCLVRECLSISITVSPVLSQVAVAASGRHDGLFRAIAPPSGGSFLPTCIVNAECGLIRVSARFPHRWTVKGRCGLSGGVGGLFLGIWEVQFETGAVDTFGHDGRGCRMDMTWCIQVFLKSGYKERVFKRAKGRKNYSLRYCNMDEDLAVEVQTDPSLDSNSGIHRCFLGTLDERNRAGHRTCTDVAPETYPIVTSS
ncbi:hypothetical protein CONLIGDRAFT_248182 [Coniochaeta ligniaria NRRL 30616]|uniref:Uncharacterized protein n=1 Tax=Coniochaeta ligniaria NRRL 30616 TaxID=1408157 RepID=A0A1J7JRI1_9PEZI|nr:hypothetical protein CONLIGDRAFT_248182 [Coniochaeta ligniaria NRRL 30616]